MGSVGTGKCAQHDVDGTQTVVAETESPDAHPDVTTSVEWESPGIRIATSTSRCPAGDWCPSHVGKRFGIALPRTGAWRRRVGTTEQFVDPNVGFFRRVGEVSEVAHFAQDVHSGTIIDVDPHLATDVVAEIADASGPFMVTPAIALDHRMLAASLRRDVVDDIEVEERTLRLVSAAVAQRAPCLTSRSRRATAASRRRAVAEVCELIHRSATLSLSEIARTVHYSPFHLSRVFHEVMGVPISKYRTRLRVHEVLMRLDEGADDLSRVAVETGFADHGHMTRSITACFGEPPSELRDRLRRAAG
jgi:AraC-like DNA-binding protein